MRHFFQHIRQQQRLKFLLKCKDYGITPPHLKGKTSKIVLGFKLEITKKEMQNIENQFLIKVLNLEIKEANIKIKMVNDLIRKTKQAMGEILDEKEYNSIVASQNQYLEGTKKKIEINLNKKLLTAIKETFEKYNLKYNEDWFTNKTKINIPTECRWLLSLGNKFALPISKKTFSPVQLIADIEQGIQTMPDDREKDIVRCKFATRVNNFKNKFRNSPKEKFILQIYEETKRFLKQHKDSIVIMNADKGSKTVMMYKSEYEDKMKDLLDDKLTYKTIRTDPTQFLLRKNNKIVNDLYKTQSINLKEKHYLSCPAATAPRIYGLPKVHKENIPLRPISSSVNVPCSRLSKYVGQILQNIVSDKYNIKNSQRLKENIKNLTIEDDETLISLDVVSLFTNIPIHFAIGTIMKQWTGLQNHTKISKTQFLKILEFCLRENNYFVHDGTFYQQTYGMPMGNPLSPTIADIVLDKIIDDSITELRSKDIHVKYITKYVDDMFAIVKINDVEEILKIFNGQHTKIKFTLERETNNKLAFLDIEVHNTENKIRTNWYKKAVASSRMIHYLSNHPWSQKKNTAIGFIKKVYSLSDQEFMEENKRNIKNILQKNGYPNAVIEAFITAAENKTRNCNINTEREDNNNKIYIGVTYVPQLTDNNTLGKIIKSNNLSYAHKPHHTIRSIYTKTKDKINKEQLHNVVYEIQCKGKQGESCNKVYIGTTKRSLETRVNEHKSDAKNNKYTTALSQHLIENNHTADFNNTKILDVENRTRRRMTLEGLRIQQQFNKAMNFKEDVDNINCAYATAITQNV
ncbi:uncharacterized protein [Eurosta solidaginis]|uniref:uncharacterized protein n=1 Tax=Eurosta solidaginis TaxID=178769 RepID=UPI003530B937